MSEPDDASEVWSNYVKEELDRQVERKASFEQRGLAVITTSGVLVTLLFGLAALSTKKDQPFALPSTSKVLLLVALGFFVLAIAAALTTNIPRRYKSVLPEELKNAVRERWGETPSAARKKVAYTRIDVLESAKVLNESKGRILFYAITCQFLALTLVAVAVGVVISQ